MKNKLNYIICIALLALSFTNAQDRKLLKANKNFEDFNFSRAINQYENILARGTVSPVIYKNLGDANYLNANYEEAAKWYGKLAESSEDVLDVEHMYRYANSLRSIRDYEASGSLLKKLQELKGTTTKGSVADYMLAIKERYGSYTIENVEINSTESDFAPSFRLDGLVFSTSRDTSGISKNIHSWNKKRFLNLYTATNLEEGGFKNIMRFSDKLNTKLHESSTAFTKDGMTVYFTRNKANGKDFGRDQKGISRLKLYRAVFENGNWGQVQELPFNQDGYSVAHPTLNKAQDKLYFASDIPGTEGQSDIFVVDIHADGSFGTPKNLGVNINTGGRETFPYVTDDDILYFSSDGHAGLGGLDIFAVDLKNIENSKIVNLGEPLNSISDDFSFIINPKTKKGYFASDRSGGMGDDDIYALTELKPIDTRCFSDLLGKVKDKETGLFVSNSKVVLIDENGKTIGETNSDAEGIFKLERECHIKNFTILATKEAYEPGRKIIEDEISNKDETNITLLLVKIDNGAPVGTDLTAYLNIKPIYFELNRSFIRKDAKATLEKIIAYLNRYPAAKIEVRSHTDSRASSTYNKALSERRAKETVNYLVGKGIASERITGMGFGESQLSNECDDSTKCSEEKHQQNRRSEFILVE